MNGSTGESGMAVIETLLLGLLLLVALIWGLTVLSELHRAALATTAAAREAGFDAARASTVADAERRVDAAVAAAFADHGLDPAAARVRWVSPDLVRGGAVEIRVSYPTAVFQAPFLGRIAGPDVWVNASHVARVDRYRSRP
jgi:Na+-transporting methylmalonyl-CoA/oxaloacetate decarboxylase gamma subunit